MPMTSLRLFTATVILSTVVFCVPGLTRGQDAADSQHWVGTWATAQVALSPPAGPSGGGGGRRGRPQPMRTKGQTVRQIVRVSIGGARVRIIFSNTYDTEPLRVGAAHVARGARGLVIYGGTLTPFKGTNYWSEAGEEKRQAVNAWIRTSGAYDGVIDFDAAVRDPKAPDRFVESYQPGDWLHPNDDGYQRMADAVDLTWFVRQPARAAARALLRDIEVATCETEARECLYEFTVTGPDTFTRPFGAAIPMRRTEAPLFE